MLSKISSFSIASVSSILHSETMNAQTRKRVKEIDSLLKPYDDMEDCLKRNGKIAVDPATGKPLLDENKKQVVVPLSESEAKDFKEKLATFEAERAKLSSERSMLSSGARANHFSRLLSSLLEHSAESLLTAGFKSALAAGCKEVTIDHMKSGDLPAHALLKGLASWHAVPVVVAKKAKSGDAAAATPAVTPADAEPAAKEKCFMPCIKTLCGQILEPYKLNAAGEPYKIEKIKLVKPKKAKEVASSAPAPADSASASSAAAPVVADAAPLQKTVLDYDRETSEFKKAGLKITEQAKAWLNGCLMELTHRVGSIVQELSAVSSVKTLGLKQLTAVVKIILSMHTLPTEIIQYDKQLKADPAAVKRNREIEQRVAYATECMNRGHKKTIVKSPEGLDVEKHVPLTPDDMTALAADLKLKPVPKEELPQIEKIVLNRSFTYGPHCETLLKTIDSFDKAFLLKDAKAKAAREEKKEIKA